MLGRRRPETRAELLARASRLAARGRLRRAARIYQALLDASPSDVDVHRKAAPVLAKRRRLEEAWRSFDIVGQSLERSGFSEKAIGVYREAAHYMPQRPEIWLAIAELYLGQEQPSDATRALVEGRARMRGRRRRPAAIRLLSRAHAIAPLPPPAVLDLARLLRRCGRRTEAWELLNTAVRDVATDRRRPLLAAQLAARPTPAALWRWLRNQPAAR